MNYEELFKPEDIATAKAEVKCIEDLLKLAILNIESGRFEKAEKRVMDILHSINRLGELNKDKQNEKEFEILMSRISNNSAADLVLREYFHE